MKRQLKTLATVMVCMAMALCVSCKKDNAEPNGGGTGGGGNTGGGVTGDHEYVDLGLPSGLLWATCNVGASKPEEYGWYFMWGSVTDGGDPNCRWANCPGNGGSPEYDEEAFNAWKAEHLTGHVLFSEVDAATQNWGEPWLMPTSYEWRELVDNTYMKWVYDYAGTGVPGLIVYKVKNEADKGLMTVDDNGNPEDPYWVTCDHGGEEAELKGEYTGGDVHLFLPAAGYRYDTHVYRVGSDGCYWSRSLSSYDPKDVIYENFYWGSGLDGLRTSRYYGHTVRPVRSAR